MKMQWRSWIVISFLVLGLTGGCGRDDDTQIPRTKILSPFDAYTITLGETVQFESRSRDDARISQVELHVDGVQIELYEVEAQEKSLRLEHSWQPAQPGNYRVTVIAYDDMGHQSQPATITVTVQSALAPTTVLPTSTPLVPAPTAAITIETPEPAQTSIPTGDCIYDAVFVADVTIPDYTRLAAGAQFIKTWRLRNAGTCDWTAGFQLIFVDGDRMGADAAVPVPPTPAGSSVDISVQLQAPVELGAYRGAWRMQTPDGKEFGQHPYVQIVVNP